MTLGLVYEYLLKRLGPLGAVATGLVFKDRPKLPKADATSGNLGQINGQAVRDILLNEISHNHQKV